MSAISNERTHPAFAVFDRASTAARARELQNEAFEALLAAVRVSGEKKSGAARVDPALPGMPPASTARTDAPSENEAASDSLFAYWVNILPTDDRFYVGDGIYQHGSRLMTLEEDYKAWKSAQAAKTLPADSCTEEEKLAWMREHYSGELGPFELVDAIEAMHDLGLMDRYEWNSVYGRRITAISGVKSTPVTGENGEQRYIITDTGLTDTLREIFEPDGRPWHDHFEQAPLHRLHTLEDLLNWLGGFRTQPVADWEVKWREVLARNGVAERYFVPA